MRASPGGRPPARRGPAPRRRPRRGSLERPLPLRLYRTSWVVFVLALLVVAFTFGHPAPLPKPALPPTFDRTTAVAFTNELAHRCPDRTPGTAGATCAANWVASSLVQYRLRVERDSFG